MHHLTFTTRCPSPADSFSTFCQPSFLRNFKRKLHKKSFKHPEFWGWIQREGIALSLIYKNEGESESDVTKAESKQVREDCSLRQSKMSQILQTETTAQFRSSSRESKMGPVIVQSKMYLNLELVVVPCIL